MAGTAAMDVTARLTADTADFDAKFKASADVATRTADLQEKASARARAAWQKEVLAQERAAAQAAESGRAKELAALRADILARSLDGEARAAEKAASAAGHSVSELQAVSAAARALEGNAGLRTFERFIASIPGAAAASSLVFPAIGFATALAVVGKLGSELYETEQKGKHAGEELARAFGETDSKLSLANDELELTNSRLGDEIAKLEKHPSNGLQTALLEAVVAADHLQESLAGDEKALEQLLKDHDVSRWQGVLSGLGDTAATKKEITDQGRAIEVSGNAARLAFREQMKAAGDDRAKQEEATNTYYGRMDQIAAAAASKMRARANDVVAAQKDMDSAAVASAQTGKGPGSRFFDLTQRRSSYEDAAVVFDEMQRRAQDSGTNFELTKKKGALEGAAAAKKDGDKASEELLKSMDAQLSLLKLQYGATIKVQFDFWERRKDQFVAGSNAYNQVVSRQTTLAEEGSRAAAATIKRFTDEERKDAEERAALGTTIARTSERMSKDRYNTETDTENAQGKLQAVQQGIRARLEEQAVQNAAGKSMTEYAAAAELAAIHTREYGVALANLLREEARLKDNPYITDDEKAKQFGALLEQQATLEGARKLQQLQDAQANDHSGSSGAVGARDALDELASSARDSASQMKGFTEATLGSFNETALKQITGKGQRGDWTHLGQDVFTNLAGVGLKKGEGSLLSGLGFGGKADGSQSNPLWVRLKEEATKDFSATSGFLKMLTKHNSSGGGSGAASGDSDDGGGGVLGNLGEIASGIVPFFADGVSNFGGGMAVVGEKGPELVRLPGGSGVIPNGKAFGGGVTHHHHYNIDARGATDPAQVNRQIMAAAPHIAAAAVKAVHERQARRPSSIR